jgi:hypothetical protein
MKKNSIVTIGDSNFFLSIGLSLLQAKKKHPEYEFAIYDIGFTNSERNFFTNKFNATVIDWKKKLVENPIPKKTIFQLVQKILSSSAPLVTKYGQVKAGILDYWKNGHKGREWMFAQKPYVIMDWSDRNLDGAILYLDADAMLYSKINEIWDDKANLSVTIRRDDEINFTFGCCHVINAGVVVFSGSPEVRRDIIQAWINKMQDRFEYLIEQSSLTRLLFDCKEDIHRGGIRQFTTTLGTYSARVLDGEVYNYTRIEKGVSPERNKILHFKGNMHNSDRYKALLKNLGFQNDLAYILNFHDNSLVSD